MKKLFLGFLFLGLLVAAAGVVALGFFLGSIVKRGVETAVPMVTKTSVKLDGASLMPVTGSGQLRGLVIGNPEGFKALAAIQVGSMSVDVVPRSLFSDKIIVHSIKVLGPEITFEGGLKNNNLTKLLENIRGVVPKTGGSSSQPSASASRKLQVDDILITGAKVNLSIGFLGGAAAAVALPDIHLSGLGQGPDGITAAELSERLLNAILDNTVKAASGQLGSLGTSAGGRAGAVDQVERAVRGIGNLLKR